MPLNAAQLLTLRADINDDGALGTQPNTQDAAISIAAVYNAVAAPDFVVWNPASKVDDVYNAITWANFTPNDAADETTIFQNRVLLAQTKQMNLQLMLQGRTTLDATRENIRAGLRDAVIQLPTGAAGALVTAGGVNAATVLTALTRKATRGEKLFASGTATTGATTASLMVVVGSISASEVYNARAN